MPEESCVTSPSAMRDTKFGQNICLEWLPACQSPFPYLLNILTGYYFFSHPIGFYGGEGGQVGGRGVYVISFEISEQL